MSTVWKLIEEELVQKYSLEKGNIFLQDFYSFKSSNFLGRNA